MRSCDEVWACSEETGETLRSYGFRKPYFVMPNGTDTAFPADPQGLKARAAERFRIPQGKRVLLFVGQQIWYKNQKLILDTLRLLCDRGDDWFLVMAGSGKDEQEIEQYAANLNLADKVLFTGLIRDRDLLRGVYLNADLLFFPSVFDNAPLVLREAAVLGVPTLAVEGSNAAGTIRKNVNGFTAVDTPKDMSDEIRDLFGNGHPGSREERGRPSRSWEKLVPMVLDRYRTVIEQYQKGQVSAMTEENKNIEPNGKDTKREEMTRTVKFVLFSISAGVIEMASFALLDALKVFDPTVCSIIALVLSVVWNFTLNREFTFRSASNVPIAMLKVAAYYAVFTPGYRHPL